MTGMAATSTTDSKITASALGSIVGMKSDEIQQIATEYANKVTLKSTDMVNTINC